MYDFYFELTDEHIKDINLLSLYHRLSDLIGFSIEAPLKVLCEKGKLDSFFSNSNMLNFLPKTRVISLKEGAIA
jgi:hypothetical protein